MIKSIDKIFIKSDGALTGEVRLKIYKSIMIYLTNKTFILLTAYIGKLF